MNRPFSAIFRHISRSPMVVALVAVVAGMILSDHYAPSLWSVVVGFVVCVAMAVVCYGKRYAALYVTLALAFAGAISMSLARADRPRIGVESLVEVRIHNPKWDSQGRFRADGEVLSVDGEACHFDVRLTARQGLELRDNERLIIKARIREFSSSQAKTPTSAHSATSASAQRYGEYMLRRGVRGEIYLSQQMIISRNEVESSWAQRLGERAKERILSLGLTPQSEAVVLAMSIGQRSSLDTSLRRDYARSGAAHLLAVSGLHVGYVFMLCNLLLLPLALLRRGVVSRSVIAIALIWCYAAVTGLSPSVLRASVMFSLLQLSLLTASRYNSLNSLCFTALILLLGRGENLYDAGFQLSVLAVFAIVEWVAPVSGYVLGRMDISAKYLRQSGHSRVWSLIRWAGRWIWRWLLLSIMISVAASLITLPLTSYLFGQISLWGVVISPLMLFLGGAVVALSVVWILLPIPFMQGLFSSGIEFVAETMNRVAAWCSQVGVLAYDEQMSLGLCLGIYALYLVMTLLLWSRRKEAV